MKQSIVLNDIDEKFIKETADSKFILKNGLKYFKLGKVKSLEVRGDMVEVVVKRKLNYNVKIYFNTVSPGVV